MSGLVKSLLGMGNPLLDIMAEVDQATLDKYKVGVSLNYLVPNVAAPSDQLVDRVRSERLAGWLAVVLAVRTSLISLKHMRRERAANECCMLTSTYFKHVLCRSSLQTRSWRKTRTNPSLR